jgi:hypothetical protein
MIILIIFFIISSCLIVVSSNTITKVSIQPTNNTVDVFEFSTIEVYCTPGEPLKSFELNIAYDPSLLNIKGIHEGSIFHGFQTFFNNGTIDTMKGEIKQIYGLIIGPGKVTTPGSLVMIDIQAMNVSGKSALILSNVGVTNETMYLPLSISHGSIEIQESVPSIHDIILSFSKPLDTDPIYGWYQIDCTIIDDNIKDSFLEIIHPDKSISTISMNQISNNAFSTRGSFLGYGTYEYTLYVIDMDGNKASSELLTFVIPPNWDVNMDGYVSVLDFTCISNFIGQQGNPGWIREDVNNDGIVTVYDMRMISKFYYQYW